MGFLLFLLLVLVLARLLALQYTQYTQYFLNNSDVYVWQLCSRAAIFLLGDSEKSLFDVKWNVVIVPNCISILSLKPERKFAALQVSLSNK